MKKGGKSRNIGTVAPTTLWADLRVENLKNSPHEEQTVAIDLMDNR